MSAVLRKKLQTNSDFNIEPGTPLVCSIPDIDGKFVIGIYTGMKDDQYFGTMFNDVDQLVQKFGVNHMDLPKLQCFVSNLPNLDVL